MKQQQQSNEAADLHPRLHPFLRRRRIARVLMIGISSLAIAAAALAHLPGLGAEDFSRFNHRVFQVTDVLAADLIRIRTDSGEETVQLLGVAAPRENERFADYTRNSLAGRLIGKPVTLLLESPQSRDSHGHLLAFAYQQDTHGLNVELVRDGLAYADRRVNPQFAPLIQQAETEARKKSHGFWKDLRTSDQPAWRQEWFAEHEKKR